MPTQAWDMAPAPGYEKTPPAEASGVCVVCSCPSCLASSAAAGHAEGEQAERGENGGGGFGCAGGECYDITGNFHVVNDQVADVVVTAVRRRTRVRAQVTRERECDRGIGQTGESAQRRAVAIERLTGPNIPSVSVEELRQRKRPDCSAWLASRNSQQAGGMRPCSNREPSEAARLAYQQLI